MSREMAHKVIVQKKIMFQIFLNSGTLVILCLFATMGPKFYSFLTIFLSVSSRQRRVFNPGKGDIHTR
jgi:hypothetical protein